MLIEEFICETISAFSVRAGLSQACLRRDVFNAQLIEVFALNVKVDDVVLCKLLPQGSSFLLVNTKVIFALSDMAGTFLGKGHIQILGGSPSSFGLLLNFI